MRSFSSFTLRQKITTLILAASCAVLLLSSAIFIGSQVITYQRLTIGELSAMADVISSNVTAAVLFDDPDSAEETLNALRAKPGILEARVYRRNGMLFASYPALKTKRPPVSGQASELPPPPLKRVFPAERGHELRLFDGYADVHVPIRLDGDVVGSTPLEIDAGTARVHLIVPPHGSTSGSGIAER